MSQSANVNANDLFEKAAESAIIQQATQKSLSSVPDLGVQITAALGAPAASQQLSEVVLLMVLVDDSSSIAYGNNEQILRDAVNLILDEVQKSKQGDNILVMTHYLNGQILDKFIPIDAATRLNVSNYSGSGWTPLYEQTRFGAAALLAKALDFNRSGVPARGILVVVSDGHDEGSQQATAADVKVVLDDMLGMEMPGFVAFAMGITDGKTDFQRIFQEMGFRANFILTPNNTPSEIRKAAKVVSRSAATASQSAANFTQIAGGGLVGSLTSGQND